MQISMQAKGHWCEEPEADGEMFEQVKGGSPEDYCNLVNQTKLTEKEEDQSTTWLTHPYAG